MPAAITITFPAPGATLGPNFIVCGTYDCGSEAKRPQPEVPIPSRQACPVTAVVLTLNGNNIAANQIRCCEGQAGRWEATFQGVAVANGYVLTAYLTCPDGQTASHSIEPVNVVPNPPIRVQPVCCEDDPPPPPPPPYPPAPETVTGNQVTIALEVAEPAATQLLAIPQAAVTTVTQTTRTHTSKVSTPGPLRMERGGVLDLRQASRPTEVRLELETGEYACLILIDASRTLGGTTSAQY
jgi:hypothetical protein